MYKYLYDSILVLKNITHSSHTVFATLVHSQYRRSDTDTQKCWSLGSHIDEMQRILTTLGVDIHTDMGYDAWIP